MRVPGGGVEPSQWGDAVRSAASRVEREISPGSLRPAKPNWPGTRCQVVGDRAGRFAPALPPSRRQFLNLYVPSQAQSDPLMYETVTEAWSPARVPVPSKMSQCPRPVVKSSEQWPVALLPDPA
jgi:hypothetical protein